MLDGIMDNGRASGWRGEEKGCWMKQEKKGKWKRRVGEQTNR